MLLKHYGLIIQEEAPTLYPVTCFIKLQKADSGGVVADSLLQVSMVPSFKGGTVKVDGGHTE